MTRSPAWVTVALLLGLTAARADTFVQHSKLFRVGPYPTSIAIADLNGDGILDIVTSNRGRLMDIREERPAEDLLSYLVGRGDLDFEPQPPLRSGFGPYQVVAVNIDALKALDLVVVNFHAARDRDLTLLRNIGETLFEPHHFTVPDDALNYTQMSDGDGNPIFCKPGLTSLVVSDVNHDGYRDVIATAWSSDALVMFPGHPELYFDKPVFIPLPGGPRDVALSDLDGDGEADLVVTLYTDNEIALLKGDGKGGFQLVDRFASRGRLPHRVRIADMNGDGRKDLVVSHVQTDDSVVVYYRNGAPFEFPVAQEIVLGENRQKLEYEIRDLVCQDFDGNGKTDIALACHTASQVVLLKNRSKGSSIPQDFERETYTFDNGKPYALAVDDLNADKKPDLAVALWDADSIALLLNRE